MAKIDENAIKVESYRQMLGNRSLSKAFFDKSPAEFEAFTMGSFAWFNELLRAKLDKFLDNVLAERSPRLMVLRRPVTQVRKWSWGLRLGRLSSYATLAAFSAL
jgi:hypothetical protein